MIYWGGKHGRVRDAYAPLDEFWVADAESGELVRDVAGEITTFRSQDLRLISDAAPPVLKTAEGHEYSGVLLVGREEHMVSILQHYGEPSLQERKNPQQLLAIPCPSCETEQLQTAASTGIVEELVELGRQLRPDLHVGVRSLYLKHVAEQLGGELLILEGFYVMAAIQLPYPVKSCEATGLDMRERHRRREIANQVDLAVTAMCAHRASEEPSVAARRALREQCRVDMTDALWSEDVQQAVRRKLHIPDLPLRVKDQTGMDVLVAVLPDESSGHTLQGVLTFSGGGGGGGGGLRDVAKPAVAPESAAPEGKIAGKTVREWEAQQKEFAGQPELPRGWLRVKSRSGGEVYFYNTKTKESTFEFPETPLPPGWTKQVSKSTGKTYYWHAGKNASSFERPRA